MCCRQVLELAPPLTPQELSNDALGEIVELLSSIHAINDEEFVPRLTFEERSGVRFMTVDCGRESIVWKVEMLASRFFRRIARYKRICRPIANGNRKSRTFLMPIKIWEGHLCIEIIRLHRLGELREGWWNYSILPRGGYRNTLNSNPGSSNNNAGSQSRAIQAEYGSSKAHDPTAGAVFHEPRPDSSLRLKLKKMRVAARLRPMMRMMTKAMMVEIVTEMKAKGRLKVMRRMRRRKLMVLRTRAMRVAAMLGNMEG